MRHSYLFIIAIMLAVMTPRIAPAQSIAVKSNVLYDLTGTLNLGGEITQVSDLDFEVEFIV